MADRDALYAAKHSIGCKTLSHTGQDLSAQKPETTLWQEQHKQMRNSKSGKTYKRKCRKWNGEKEVAANCWHSKYLDSIYEVGGGEITDVRKRIAMDRTRFGQLRHIWHDKKLHYILRLRLYEVSVCSILTYGSEAWNLRKEVVQAINSTNASVLSDKTQRKEASAKLRSFDLSQMDLYT